MGRGGVDASRQVGSAWRGAVDAWVDWMTAGACSPGTLRLRRHYLLLLARRYSPRSPWVLQLDDLVDWLAEPGWSVETRRSARASVRGFYRWAAATGRVEADPSALLPTIAPPRVMADPAPEDVIVEAFQRAEPRDRLMLWLAAGAGLRRAEIAGLHAEHVLRGADGWALRVTGKGGHERRVPVPDDIARDLRRAADGGWVFPGPHGHLSPDYVGRLVSRALPGRWTAHKLRHRFATVAYRCTRDAYAVQELLGHAKLDTTRRYIQLPDDALRAAASAAWDAA